MISRMDRERDFMTRGKHTMRAILWKANPFTRMGMYFSLENSKILFRMEKENFSRSPVNYYARANFQMVNWLDKERDIIKMDRFLLKANGSKIKRRCLLRMWKKNGGEGCFNEGIFSGKGAKFYENGNKRIEGEWANGKQQHYEFYYFIDKMQGFTTGYYETGEKQMEGSFKEEKFEGFAKFFEKDGSIKYEGYFLNGQPLDQMLKKETNTNGNNNKK